MLAAFWKWFRGPAKSFKGHYNIDRDSECSQVSYAHQSANHVRSMSIFYQEPFKVIKGESWFLTTPIFGTCRAYVSFLNYQLNRYYGLWGLWTHVFWPKNRLHALILRLWRPVGATPNWQRQNLGHTACARLKNSWLWWTVDYKLMIFAIK